VRHFRGRKRHGKIHRHRRACWKSPQGIAQSHDGERAHCAGVIPSALALSPAYVRISGTWANTTYFADTAETPPEKPPEGYGAVLTYKQWLGTIAFSRAVDAPIVTSMPIGEGTRGADGARRPDQARKWLASTIANRGTIALSAAACGTWL
jgi:hypothetical protein